MRFNVKQIVWLICLVLVGCSTDQIGDEANPVAPPSEDMGFIRTDQFTQPPQRVDVSLTVAPAQATYAIGSEVEITGNIGRNGGSQRSTAWYTVPEGFGVRLSEGTLKLTEAGSGIIKLCEENVCAEVPIFVVDQPTIQLNQPNRGQMLQLDESDSVLITGRIENLEMGFPTVLVNGEVAETDEDFNFSISIAAVTGLNQLSIEVLEPTLDEAPTLYMQFIAAREFFGFNDGGLRVTDAITVFILEDLLDSDLPSITATPGETVQVSDIVQLLELVIQTSEPLRWLPDPLTSLEGLNLNVDGISFGELDGDISIPSTLAEASFLMTGAQIRTSGDVDFMGSSLSLDGTMTASLSAFLILDGDINDTIILNLQEIEAELLSVEADYPSSTLNDLLEALDSELTDQVIDVLTNFIKSLFEEQALPLVQYAFEAMLEQIQILPIVVESPLEGIPNVELNARVQPRALDLSRGQAKLRVDVEISGVESPIEHTGDLGVFSASPRPAVVSENTPLMLEVKEDLLNALCYSIWKTGLLNSSPEIPDAIAGLVSAVTANAKLPPVINFGVGQSDEVMLQVGELELAVTPNGSASPDLYILHLTVPAILAVQDGFISLQLNGQPSVRVDTLAKSSDSAINAQTIESLLLGAIWPLFQDTLSEGLTYGIGSIPIDTEILDEIAPGLTSLSLTPIISTNFVQAPGVITVGGQLIMEGTLDTPPPNPIE